MALPLPAGLTPAETAFLCENEPISVVPRERLDSIPLLSVCLHPRRLIPPANIFQGATPILRPPHPAQLPLWLALLLHRQNRATILPPAWLSPTSLEDILQDEIASPTFTRGAHELGPDSRAPALPYHWLTLSHLLLTHCASSFPPQSLGPIATLLRSLREVRQAKLRSGIGELDGGGVVSLRGVGGLEVCEERGFVVGVVGGLRRLGARREAGRREREVEGGVGGTGRGGTVDEDEGEELGMEEDY
jgi:GINS complex subunit 2